MKRTLSILYVVVVLSVFVVIVVNEIFERQSLDRTAGARVGTEFAWPSDTAVADPELALQTLAQAAEATGANVLRTSVGSFDSGRDLITHYVYLGSADTDLYDEFTLVDGRWLTMAESRTGSAIVSSRDVQDEGRVGTPNVFAGGYDLAFVPLQRAFDSLPAAGRYAVEAADAMATERFLRLVQQGLVDAGLTDVVIEDLRVTGSEIINHDDRMWIFPFVLVGVATVLVVSLLLNSGKHIGVLRLLGYSTTRVWYRLVGRLQLSSGIAGILIGAAITLLIPGTDAALFWTLVVGLAQVSAVGFVATALTGWGVIKRVYVTDLIKGSMQ